MAGFIEGVDRGQSTLFPARLDEYVADDNPVRVIDLFVDGLDLDMLGFERVQPLATGRPGYHPGTMLKIYIYGYLNRVPSSRRLHHVSGNVGCVRLDEGSDRLWIGCNHCFALNRAFFIDDADRRQFSMTRPVRHSVSL